MKKILFLLLLAGVSLSCSKENEETELCCTVIDLDVLVNYVDEDGNNLLGIEGIDPVRVRVQNQVGDQWRPTDNPPMLVNLDGEPMLRIYVNPGTPEELVTHTRVLLSPDETDLIKTELNKDGSNIVITKLWYNGELRWEGDDLRKIVVVR